MVGEEGGVLSWNTVTPYAQLNRDSKWHGEYIMISLLERAGDGIIEAQRSVSKGPADALYSYPGFRRAFASILYDRDCDRETLLTDIDTDLLLKFLERDRGVLVYEATERVRPSHASISRSLTYR